MPRTVGMHANAYLLILVPFSLLDLRASRSIFPRSLSFDCDFFLRFFASKEGRFQKENFESSHSPVLPSGCDQRYIEDLFLLSELFSFPLSFILSSSLGGQ